MLPLLRSPAPRRTSSGRATFAATVCLAAATATATVITLAPAPAEAAERARHQHTSWTSTGELGGGTLRGTTVRRGAVRLAGDTRTRSMGGRRYDTGRWTSPWAEPGFSLTELIPSWQATTRRDTFVDVRVRGRRADGSLTRWDRAARWTTSEKWVERTTFGAQSGDGSRMNVDTWQTPGVVAWQVRLDLHRRAGSKARVVVHRVGAVASRVPARSDVPTSRTGPADGVELDVPAWSQMVHTGHYPQWGGGGEAWCSPTSLSMVLGHWDALPPPRSYRWVAAGDPAPWVDQAARMVYDHGYDGAGNWAFNTAWAGTRVGETYVTRLPSLRAAERFIADGVPLIVSIAFDSGELRGAPIGSSNGHLLVVRGFTGSGDVIVNDPAADPRQGERVRRVYDRAQFEDVWQLASDGLTYVVRD